MSFLVFGSFNTLVLKNMDLVQVGKDEKGEAIYFKHPYFQCANMMAGMMFCFVYYLIYTLAFKKHDDKADLTESQFTENLDINN